MSSRVGAIREIFNSETIEDTATVYSRSIRVGAANVLGIAYQASSSAGAPDIKIEIQQSYKKPTTEEADDDTYVVPEDMSDVETNLVTETWHVKSLSLVPMEYMRFKITGNAANESDTALTIQLFVQEEA